MTTMTDTKTFETPERVVRIIAKMEAAGTQIDIARVLMSAHVDAVLEFARETTRISEWVTDQDPELARMLGVGKGDPDEPELPFDKVTETT
jgi:hypothetical protein